MNRIVISLIVLLILVDCNKHEAEILTVPIGLSLQDNQKSSLINEKGSTIKTRFIPPNGYQWVETKANSFGGFIEQFPLKNFGSPILKYDGSPIRTQHLHQAVLDIDIGDKDLQQCADAVLRLKAEYLFQTNQIDKINFYFTNGDQLSWSDYKSGIRAVVNGNKVQFQKLASADDSRESFRNYLNLIFTYAGTISLTQFETKAVTKNNDLKTGDILITAGSPGHVVFIAGVVENAKGERLYLLGQGFTPAQSIHILTNPNHPTISPWYNLDVNANETRTARYIFKPNNFRTFKL